MFRWIVVLLPFMISGNALIGNHGGDRDTIHTSINLNEPGMLETQTILLQEELYFFNASENTIQIQEVTCPSASIQFGAYQRKVASQDSSIIPLEARILTNANDTLVYFPIQVSTNSGPINYTWSIAIVGYDPYPMTSEEVNVALKELSFPFWFNEFPADWPDPSKTSVRNQSLVTLKPTRDNGGTTGLSFQLNAKRRVVFIVKDGYRKYRYDMATYRFEGNMLIMTIEERFQKTYEAIEFRTIYYEIIDVKDNEVTAKCWVE